MMNFGMDEQLESLNEILQGINSSSDWNNMISESFYYYITHCDWIADSKCSTDTAINDFFRDEAYQLNSEALDWARKDDIDIVEEYMEVTASTVMVSGYDYRKHISLAYQSYLRDKINEDMEKILERYYLACIFWYLGESAYDFTDIEPHIQLLAYIIFVKSRMEICEFSRFEIAELEQIAMKNVENRELYRAVIRASSVYDQVAKLV